MRELFSWDRFFECIPQILPYFWTTLEIVLVATIAGVILGLVVAFLRIKKIPVISQLLTVYISFMRGTPMLVQLSLILYGLPLIIQPLTGVNIGREWDKIYFAYATFILNQGAFLSVIFQSALQSVPVGQMEAGQSVGLTELQCYEKVMIPQAVKIAIPPFGNDLVGLFQNTSLVFTIGVLDLMGRAKSIGYATSHMLEPYIFVSMVYIVISLAVRLLFHLVERKLNHANEGG